MKTHRPAPLAANPLHARRALGWLITAGGLAAIVQHAATLLR